MAASLPAQARGVHCAGLEQRAGDMAQAMVAEERRAHGRGMAAHGSSTYTCCILHTQRRLPRGAFLLGLFIAANIKPNFRLLLLARAFCYFLRRACKGARPYALTRAYSGLLTEPKPPGTPPKPNI